MKNKLFFALFLLLTLRVMPAFADSEVCRMSNGFLDNGIGGTGLMENPSGENGIGGTGHEQQINSDGQNGIGGTGHQRGNGIGGTGSQLQQKSEVIYISGTIYAHGSICINGVRVIYTKATPVQDGHKKTEASKLKLGQVVQIIAEKRKGETTLRAHKITVVHVLEGRISHIDKDQNKLTVMGESVLISHAAGASLFKEGQFIRVSGLRSLAGDIVATQITQQEKASSEIVSGPVQSTDGNRLMVGQTPVVGRIKADVGTDVTVSGHWNGSALEVTKVAPSVENFPSKVSYVSIEGYVGAPQTVVGRPIVGTNISQGRMIVMGLPSSGGSVVVKNVQDVPKGNTETHIEENKRDSSASSVDKNRLNDIASEAGEEAEAYNPDNDDHATPEKVEKAEKVETPEKTETPEVETPEVETPEVETPEVETPEVETPEVETPEVETPEVETPEVEVPEVEVPEVEVPEVEVPEVEVPEVEVPEVEPPEVEKPEIED